MSRKIFKWVNIPHPAYAIIREERHLQMPTACSHFLKKQAVVKITHAQISRSAAYIFEDGTYAPSSKMYAEALLNAKQLKVVATSANDFTDGRTETSPLYQYVGPEEVYFMQKPEPSLFTPPSAKGQLPEY